MKSECPLGHTENLSHEELAKRLSDNDFSCKEEGCTKNCSYEVDERFWNQYIATTDSKITTPENLQ